MAVQASPGRDGRRPPPRRHVPTLAPVACALCGSRRARTVLTPHHLEQLAAFHRAFHARYSVGPQALWKEKLHFLHRYPTYVVRCQGCGAWYRNPALTALGARRGYEADPYDPRVLELLRRRYLRQYRGAVGRLRRWVPKGARVLEVGSYAAAFLEAGRAAGWVVEGVDVGRDVVRYARDLGLTVHLGDVRELDLPPEGYDAVFVWHCFEQVPEPYGFLLRLRDLLRPGGLLALRTPNATYYGAALGRLRDGPPAERRRLAEHLAFNGLLPFPFARAYPPEGLRLMLAACGFVEAQAAGSASGAAADPTYRPRARVRGALLDGWAARALRPAVPAGPAAPWLEVTARRGRREPA